MLQLNGVNRFEVIAVALAPLSIPDFGGSMVRGALGHALRHGYCSCGEDVNAHAEGCIYAALFDTGEGHAFVITPPAKQNVAESGCFSFYITLLEAAPAIHDAFFQSLESALLRGLGTDKVACQIVAIAPVPLEFIPLQQQVTLTLTSPWFIKYQSRRVPAHQLTLANFLIALTQRQRELVRRGLLNVELPNNEHILEWAEQLDSQLDLHDIDGERWSNRQHKKHQLSGCMGRITITTQQQDGLKPLTALLYRAQWLHGGAKVSFGLGALTLQPIALAQSQFDQLQHFATGAAQ